MNIRSVEKDKFRDYEKYWNKYYKCLEPGTVSKNHLFTVEDKEPTMLKKWVDDLEASQVKVQDLKKKGVDDKQHFILLWSTFPDSILEPGIADIKKVELFTNFRPLLPPQFQDMSCPDPGKEVLQKIKTEEKERLKGKMSSMTKKRKEMGKWA